MGIEKWGPSAIDSKDYIAYIQSADLGPTGEPQRMLGVGLTSPNQNLVDALRTTKLVTRRGQVIPVTTVKRAAFETYRDYTANIPTDSFWSPLQTAAESNCLWDFFLVLQCPPDAQYAHFLTLEDTSIDPIIEAQDVITNGEDTNIIDWTTKLTVTQQRRGYVLGVDVIYDLGDGSDDDPIAANAIAFMIEDCVGCDYKPGYSLVVVGGDGTDTPSTIITEDRFSSVLAPTNGTAADVGKAVYTYGDRILRFDYTGASFSAAIAGKSFVSTDRGVTWAAKSIILPIADVVGDGSLVFAGGKDAAGVALLYMSTDGGDNWTTITSTGLPAATTILRMAYDKVKQRLYMGCSGGKVLVGKVVGSGMQITALTANIAGISTNDIMGIAVLAPDNVVVVGAAGFASETRNGGRTWRQMSISGSTALTSVAGNKYRAYAGAGSNLYKRDILTMNRWEKVTLEDGQTLNGTITDIEMGPEDNFNIFVITTNTGNVAFAKGFYPGA